MTRVVVVVAGAFALLAVPFTAPASAGCNHNVPGPCVRTFEQCAVTAVTYELCGY